MPIRPSFIATRINGVESYRFSHLPCPYTIDGRGTIHPYLIHGRRLIYRGTRSDCVAAMMDDANYLF